MKPKLTIVLGLIVITPLCIIGWLGVRIVHNEQGVVENRLRELMLGQLRTVDAALARSLSRYQQLVLEEMTPSTLDTEALRSRGRESPYLVQCYVLDADGRLLFPPVRNPASLSIQERESLQRTGQIWDSGALVDSGLDSDNDSPQLASPEGPAANTTTGWHSWFWGDGLQMMLWKREGEYLHAAEINRTRLLAELIAALPETDALAPELAEGRIRLLESTGRSLYQWGSFEAAEDAAPAAALALSSPLRAWTLEYHAPPAAFGSAVLRGYLLNLGATLAALAAVVLGLTLYFYREQSHEMSEAAQRVSFVNQVSHELKTPLTNIRMYAELLERDADELDELQRRHIGVIVAESQRLSRLIGNVLTFSRKQRRTLELRRAPGVVDDVLRSVLDHFKPALEAKQIELELELAAGQTVRFDADAVEQIVGNLISNVEKYGAAGKHMTLTSRHQGETTMITVSDLGPGIPRRARQKIFEPFYRVNSALTEGVSGTGIGLAIARDLARLHGGDLQLEPSEHGARFRVTLHCPPVTAEG